jgi:hypothetical protein
MFQRVLPSCFWLVEIEVELLGAFYHLLVADGTGVGEQREAVGSDDLIHVLLPEVHARLLLALGAQFCGFEEDDHQPVQGVDLVLGQVVLGHDDVRACALCRPARRAGQNADRRDRARGDEFGRGLLCHGKDQQILHRGEEGLRGLVGLVVVAGEGKEVAHLLVKAFFRGTDIPDARQHLVEVIRAAIRVLQPRVIHREALDAGTP